MRQYVLQYQYCILRRASALLVARNKPRIFTTRYEMNNDDEAKEIAQDWVIRNRNWLRVNGNREVTLWCFPDEYTLAYLVELYEVPDVSDTNGESQRYQERWDKIEKLEIRNPPVR